MWNAILAKLAAWWNGPVALPPAPSIPGNVPTQPNDASGLLELHNFYRTKIGMFPLVEDTRLRSAAQAHAAWMAANDIMSHIEQAGTPLFVADTFVSRINKYGYSPSACGENIAAGQRTTQQVMTAWMNSAGHKRNILSPSYKSAGFGSAKGVRGQMYWCAVFGSTMTRNFVNPVVSTPAGIEG